MNDDEYICRRLEAKDFASFSDAMRFYINIGTQLEREKEAGKDETMFAVRKAQGRVVKKSLTQTQLDLTKRIDDFDEKVSTFFADFVGKNKAHESDQNFAEIRDALNRTTDELEAVKKHLADLKMQAEIHAIDIRRLLEICVICYGTLRHYVLGILSVRLTKQKYSGYEAGFRKRVRLWAQAAREGNELLDADYEKIDGYSVRDDSPSPLEKHADDFAHGLSDVTLNPIPQDDAQQAAFQLKEPPTTSSDVLEIPPGLER